MSQRRSLGLMWWASVLASSILLHSAVITYAAPQGANYKVVRRIPVGGEGGWDYMQVDPDAHRIYLSRETHMMVVDEISGKIVGDVPDTKGIHGVAIAPEMNKGFTSNGEANTVTVFDLKTLKPLSQIKVTGEKPDSIIYDPQTERVFTFNKHSNNATAIDAANGQVLGTVILGGSPEEPALDGKGSLYINLEDKSAILKFDTKTLAVTGGPWPLAPCEGPSALAIDTVRRRLFAACVNKVMAVVNADTGKVIASPPIGQDPDGNGYDPSTGLLFASCREGFVSVIHQDSPDKYSAVGNVTTQFGTRTMTVDLKTHHVFTVTADFKPAGAPTPDNPRSRPTPIAGSFVLLELGQ
jgi:DNA-binding beta-propeller fold protein YncE